VESSNASRQAAQHPSPVKVAGLTIPAREKILQAFQELGTATAVARFFGVSRRTIDRWIRKLNLQPELRPEVPINQLMHDLLSEPEARIRVAQWIADEGSISVAYDCRVDSTSLLVAGAMNDDAVVDAIAQVMAVRVAPGPIPTSGRLPMHIIRVQGPKAYGLLHEVGEHLTGLKALEAKAALSFFPSSGRVKGRLTTDTYMNTAWSQFARQCVETWNRKRKSKLSSNQTEEIIEAWIANRTNRARRGLTSKDSRMSERAASATFQS